MDKLNQPGARTIHILLAGIFGSLLATWIPVLAVGADRQSALILSGLAILTGWLPGLFGSILGEIACSKIGGRRALWQLGLAFLAGLAAILVAWQAIQPGLLE